MDVDISAINRIFSYISEKRNRESVVRERNIHPKHIIYHIHRRHFPSTLPETQSSQPPSLRKP